MLRLLLFVTYQFFQCDSLNVKYNCLFYSKMHFFYLVLRFILITAGHVFPLLSVWCLVNKGIASVTHGMILGLYFYVWFVAVFEL